MTMVFERIKQVAELRKLSIDSINDKAGLSNKAIYGWKKSTPKADNLQKVADVLDVSTDYLLGRTNQMNSYDSQSKKTDILDDSVILAFDGMEIPEEDKEKLLDYARFVMEQRKEGKKGRLHL
ncbi:helix-turn-helix domain-containing protein [Fructobacillus sp. M158]|uniref:helix-turn-helix domain-containing protein n=1 Tax=Fructobacillus parabroussonetiae TaxID=2713174 RepID=UPI00200B5DCE|nr:helix-turn-helix transcriptional regulator [Fructobacillus parabroussonetiae]MCK8617330.1 helix-turn-helix domain-containing protein [Fructobacillus parabroussonetiae]